MPAAICWAMCSICDCVSSVGGLPSAISTASGPCALWGTWKELLELECFAWRGPLSSQPPRQLLVLNDAVRLSMKRRKRHFTHSYTSTAPRLQFPESLQFHVGLNGAPTPNIQTGSCFRGSRSMLGSGTGQSP